MKILSVGCLNLNSLRGEHRLDFSQPPFDGSALFAITGPTGAGKTTLLDAITLALFGCTPRQKDGRPLMSFGTNECRAEVLFEVESGVYLARWSLKRRPRKREDFQPVHMEVCSWPDGQPLTQKKTEAEEKIQLLLGLTYDQFLRSVLLAQGGFTQFLKAPANERADLLEKMTGTARFRQLSIEAYQAWKVEEAKTATLEARLGDVKLLAEPEIIQLRGELAQIALEAAAAATLEEGRRREQQWHTQLRQLQQRRMEAEAALHRLVAEREAAAPELERLTRHEQAAPLAPLVEFVRAAEQVVARTRAELTAGNEALPPLKLAADQARMASEAARRTLTEAQQTLAQQRPILQQVQQEAALIEHERAQLEQTSADYKQRNEKQKELKAELDRQQADYSGLDERITHLTAYLTEHRAAAELEQELPALSGELPLFQSAQQQLQKLSAERERLLQEGARARQEHQTQEAAAQRAETGLRALDAQLRDQLAEAAGLLVAELDRREQLDGQTKAADVLLRTLRRTCELERRMLGYAPDRHDLAAGKPCPLCGATEHPFAAHFELTDESLAQREAEVEEQERAVRQLADDLSASREVVTLLTDYAGEQAVRLTYPLEAAVDRARLLSRELPAGQQRRAELAGQQVMAIQLARRAAEAETAALQQLTLIDEQVQEETDKATYAADNIRRFVARFGLVFDGGNGPLLLHELTGHARAWQQQKEAMTATQTQRQTLAERLKAQERAVDEGQEWLSANRQPLLDRYEALRQREADNTARYPGQRPPAEELAFLEKAAENVQTAYEHAQQQQRTAEDAMLTAVTTRDALVNRLADEKAACQQRQADLLAECQRLGLPDETTLRAQLLDSATAAHLSQWRDELRQQLETAQTNLTRCAADLAAGQAQGLTAATAEETEQALAEAVQQGRELIARQTSVGNRLADDERNRAAHQQQATELAAQQAETLRWKELADLIGSAKGDAFSRFAQGLTLAQLVNLANQHLRHLNNRYRLRRHHEADRPLDLLIIDRYQADNAREVSTLSGGESFLVSLALALGLSELAASTTQLDSLFIDEGFGTLDAEALDIAISALENLQARGKTIGIISHVDTLKERISTQIVVEKGSDGFSTLRTLPEVRAEVVAT